MQNKINTQKKNQYSLVADETLNNDPNSKSNVQTSDKKTKNTKNTKNQIITGM